MYENLLQVLFYKKNVTIVCTNSKITLKAAEKSKNKINQI